jgi:hypothetical protein
MRHRFDHGDPIDQAAGDIAVRVLKPGEERFDERTGGPVTELSPSNRQRLADGPRSRE